ncbi:MAG: hypothetical protein AAB531_02040 [Patescibacteria group bacterium]
MSAKTQSQNSIKPEENQSAQDENEILRNNSDGNFNRKMSLVFSKKGILSLFTLILVIGIGATTIAVQRSTEYRQQAAGCVRNGTTIDVTSSCSLPDAVVLAQENDKILIWPGVYNLTSNLFIEKSLILQGESKTTSIITASTPQTISAINVAVVINNLTIGPKIRISSGGTGGLAIGNNNFVIDDSVSSTLSLSEGTIVISNNNFSGKGSVVIDSFSPISLDISQNTINGEFLNGLVLQRATPNNLAPVTVQGNTINVGRITGLESAINLDTFINVTIKNNNIIDSSTGIAIYNEDAQIQNIAQFPDGNGFSNNDVNCQSFLGTVFPSNEPTAKTKCPDGPASIPTNPTPTQAPIPTPIPTLKPGGGYILLDLYPQHVSILKDPKAWLAKLNDAYNAFYDLTGELPFNGGDITIKEVPASQMPGAEMYAGNPIQWADQYVVAKLNNINDHNDLSFGPIHELGHDFDIYFSSSKYLAGSGSSPINVEHWANFKLTYVSDTLAKKYPTATFYQSAVGFLPIGEFSQKYFVDIFAQEWLSSSKSNWKDMKGDVYTGLLYFLAKKYGWDIYKKTFRDYLTITDPTPSDDLEKVDLFVKLLSKNAGVDLKPQFICWGIPLGTMPSSCTNLIPTLAPTSKPTPTPTTKPTPTPTPRNTAIYLTIGLDGIGAAGDNANRNDLSASTKNPKRITRDISIEIYNPNNSLVATKTGNIAYNSSSGLFTGTINTGTLNTGNYIVLVSSPGYLKRRLPGVTSLTSGETYKANRIDLIAGDINNDNILNIADYNILADCVYIKTKGKICNQNASYGTISDLNDNGVKNIYDYGLLLREIKFQSGDGDSPGGDKPIPGSGSISKSFNIPQGETRVSALLSWSVQGDYSLILKHEDGREINKSNASGLGFIYAQGNNYILYNSNSYCKQNSLAGNWVAIYTSPANSDPKLQVASFKDCLK